MLKVGSYFTQKINKKGPQQLPNGNQGYTGVIYGCLGQKTACLLARAWKILKNRCGIGVLSVKFASEVGELQVWNRPLPS